MIGAVLMKNDTHSFPSKQTVLANQVNRFVDSLNFANNKRTILRPSEDYEYLRSFFLRVIEDRNKRADEIDSDVLKQATAIAKRLLPYPTYLENCMDGRLFGPLLGLYGHIGDVLSVAGGILYEFVRDENQNLRLMPHSNFGQMLSKYLNQHGVLDIVEILDSHVGCAARGAEEIARGKYPKDNGLLTDVLQKMEMGNAIREYVTTLYKDEKRVFPINISTDPRDGFMYMGLATPKAIGYAMAREGFTQEALDYLVENGTILSTRNLAYDPKIEKVFEKHFFSIDITHKYAESALLIWKRVELMYEELIPYIREKLLLIYPHIKRQPLRQKELEERAIILLVNAFTGYLHKKIYPVYPYAEHHEEGVLVSKGNNPPYEVSLFGESSLDMNNLPSNIDLASSIVRNNRKLDRVKDMSGLYKERDDFVAAPIGVFMEVKVLDELSPEQWDKLLKIDWTDLADIAWESMKDITFLNYLEDKDGTIPLCVVNAINKLRKRVSILYDMDEAIASRLIDHDIVVLPIIADVSRRVRFVIPFLKTGFL